jgi:hypothetical protein
MDARVCTCARSRMFATLWAYYCPPLTVAMPRALSASAISLRVRAPAFWASRMMGSTLPRPSWRPRRSCGPGGALGCEGHPTGLGG